MSPVAKARKKYPDQIAAMLEAIDATEDQLAEALADDPQLRRHFRRWALGTLEPETVADRLQGYIETTNPPPWVHLRGLQRAAKAGDRNASRKLRRLVGPAPEPNPVDEQIEAERAAAEAELEAEQESQIREQTRKRRR